ncbi:MAG: hypothetical protein IJ206_04305 [Oscillospiraceae bacterium]|nr:hypothetical protein [Oscillospiraceae bacterium]
MTKREIRRDKRACNRIVMAVNSERPMSKRERKADYAYAITLVSLGIFVPLISIPWLMTVKRPLAALSVTAVSVAAALIIGLSRRRSILKQFFQIGNGQELMTILKGDDRIADLMKVDEVLLCVLPQRACYLDLVYAWLCRQGLVIPGETLPCWRVDGEELMPYLRVGSELSGPVFLMRFDGRLPDDPVRFYREKKICRHLPDQRLEIRKNGKQLRRKCPGLFACFRQAKNPRSSTVLSGFCAAVHSGRFWFGGHHPTGLHPKVLPLTGKGGDISIFSPPFVPAVMLFVSFWGFLRWTL